MSFTYNLLNQRVRLSTVVLLCAGVGALWYANGWANAPYITNDGYQYLDAAASVASGRCLCTHMTDVGQRVTATGGMPVPFTQFAPGYPLLIAGLSRFGPSLETAGYLISAIGFLLSIWLIEDTGRSLGGPPWLAFVFALLWIGHRRAVLYSSMILTESIFTAAIVGMVALVVRDLRAEGKRPRLLVSIGALAGAAYALRYSGLFLIPPALLFMLWRWWRNRETLPWALGGVCAVGAFVIPIQVRNMVATGPQILTFTAVPNAFTQSLIKTVVASYFMVMGDPIFPLGVWEGLLVAFILAACWLAFRGWRRGAWANPGECLPQALGWIGLFFVAYVAGIFIALMTTTSQDPPRYYLPVYPLVLTGLAGATSLIRRNGLRAAIGITALAVLGLESSTFAFRPNTPLHVLVAQELHKELSPGESLQSWLVARVPPGAVIFAQEGEALHYVLNRPVVSILDPPELSDPSDSGTFLDLMTRYKSRYLLLFPAIQTGSASFPFLNGLLTGETHDWLKLRVRTPDIAVYECEVCVK